MGGYVCCCWIFFPLSMLVFEILSWLCYLKPILNHPVQCLREVGFDDLQRHLFLPFLNRLGLGKVCSVESRKVKT